jgi:hypothetical protein
MRWIERRDRVETTNLQIDIFSIFETIVKANVLEKYELYCCQKSMWRPHEIWSRPEAKVFSTAKITRPPQSRFYTYNQHIFYIGRTIKTCSVS